MRSSVLATLVCLVVSVTASPTPFNSESLQARDAWTPPQRRAAFVKRVPDAIEERDDIIDIDEHSAFTFAFPAHSPSTGTVTFSQKASGNDLNARYPFFVKRGGNLEARDIEVLAEEKAAFEKREAEQTAKREAEDLAKRETEALVARQAEELAKREAEELAERESWALKKREVYEDIKARELELVEAKREYEEMLERELMEYVSRDINAGEALDFSGDTSVHFAKREPQFGLGNLIGFRNGTANGNNGGRNARIARLNALLNALRRIFGFNFRRDEMEGLELSARNLDDELYLSKREPQFNLANLIGLRNGTANGNTGTGLNNRIARLNALFNELRRIFGFIFRRDDMEELELTARDFDEDLYLSKREPQFNLANLLNSFRNGTANGNTGTGNGANAGLARVSALLNGRLGSILSNLGFNFRRDEVEVLALVARAFDDELNLSKREPQFNIANLLNSFRNGTANGNTGTGRGANTGLARLSVLSNGPLGGFLRGLGFNFRRDEIEALELVVREFDDELELFKREPQLDSFVSSFRRDKHASNFVARAFPFNSMQETVTKREPFGLDAFVKEKRGY